MSDVLLREDRDGLCTLTLNRPDKLNALNTALFQRLDEECARLEEGYETTGCVVLKGAGRAFCAGADLKDFAAQTTPVDPEYKAGIIDRIAALPQTVIVQIQGLCITGGLELALGGDLIVAGASAKFADTHGKWGFVGGWGMSQRLPLRIGTPNAKLMMLTSRSFGAEQAHGMGLVDICVPDDCLDVEINTLASDILANSWHTNRAYKALMSATSGMSLKESLAYERAHFPGNSPDYRERLRAFQEGR
jgi:enoyl-CoA hydratase